MQKELLGKELLFFDGGMGTMLQEKGLLPGELPEIWNITKREIVTDIHRQYIDAGSNMILANTFGANAVKFHDPNYSLKDVVTAAVLAAKEAAKISGKPVDVAMDVGPTGKLLKPLGSLAFEEAYEAFREAISYGAEAGADFVHIETMSDTYEMKAAVLAAKEATDLPIFATMMFDEKGKLLTGGDVPAAVALLEGLRVDAIGLNCGMGPKQMVSVLRKLRAYTSLPIIVKPNAGLPLQKDGETYYDVSPETFAEAMEEMVKEGACLVGGCCGTTPKHIKAMTERLSGRTVLPVTQKKVTMVSSYGKTVVFGEKPLIIGERINPTGKKKLKEALQTADMDYLLREGALQQEKGAHILDVNAGLPGIDETFVLTRVVEELQGVTSLPLQIDTAKPEALKSAMRIYNGKPMVNSVNGKQESMDAVFPLVQKYGGVVVGLTLDEGGIPKTAEGRVRIAGNIIREAEKYGIPKKDIVIDVLTMTVSAQPDGAKTTLEALRMVRERYGVHTVLGVSNVSFGLPDRPVLNAAFYTMALANGLSAGIINPLSETMMGAYDSYLALTELDENFTDYMERHGGTAQGKSEPKETKVSLYDAVEKGLKEEAVRAVRELLREKEPLTIIDEALIPALDHVGDGFEKGTLFLPQLLMSAAAANKAFEVLRETMEAQNVKEEAGDKIILATVKGDIHDIGKNIVKVLLQNYGFDVIDLGKDVPPERIVRVAKEEQVSLVGLSALMTTTVASMEETIGLLRKECKECKVMVGGAVLNEDYAKDIGADFYGKDAMQSVRYAKEHFGKQEEKHARD